MSKAKEFVFKYWFDKNGTVLSKCVTTILGWFDEQGKLTLKGRIAYRKLVNNLK